MLVRVIGRGGVAESEREREKESKFLVSSRANGSSVDAARAGQYKMKTATSTI